jgi:hypothetical protein
MSDHLVTRLNNMAHDLPTPRLGEWDVPGLLRDAAEEIERLRAYALELERRTNSIDVGIAREKTQVNWAAIHGVYP